MLDGFLAESILGKALERGLLSVKVHDLRDWTTDKHHTADDRPFGGGAGMVLKPEPVFAAIEQLQTPGCRRIYLTPDGDAVYAGAGRGASRTAAPDPAQRPLRGHRPAHPRRPDRPGDQHRRLCADQRHTGGGGGDRCAGRFIPGVLGEEKSLTHESFTGKLLDFPQYTRPAEFRGMSVPEVLLSGNHGEIEKWRHARRMEKTRQVRPDLLK
jgi:tRNA (guanine37-N1)-methyltransferase